MKFFIQLMFLLVLSYAGYSQYTTTTHLAGTVTYGATAVTVRGGGTFSSYSAWCGAGPYWIGNGGGSGAGVTPSPGSYTFAFNPSVNGFRVLVTAADGPISGGPGESVTLEVNGVRFAITTAVFTAWASTCGTSAMSISGDSLLGTGSNQAAILNILRCGIDSVKVSTNGVNNGLVFSFLFTDTAICGYAANNGPICQSDTLRLYCVGDSSGATYSWTGPGGYTSTLQNPRRAPLGIGDTGVYMVVKTVGSSRDTFYTTPVVYPTPPPPTIPVIFPICSGQTINLTCTDTGSATYVWTGPNGFTSTLQSPSITNATTSASGFYYVTATLNGCSSPTSRVNVRVDSTPVIPYVASNSALCSGDTLKLFSDDSTAGVRYSWAGPASFTSTRQNPILVNAQTFHSGIYTVTAILGNCSNRASTVVTINQTPSTPILTSNAPVCDGSLLTLNALVIPGTGVYYWSGPGGFTSSISNPSIYPANMGNAGRYSVYEIVDGCTSPTASINIVMNITPQAPIVTSNAPICEGDTLNLYATDSTAGVTYRWAGPMGFTSTVQNPVFYNVLAAQGGVYTVTAILGPCSSFNIIDINITSTPPLTITHNSPVCSGDTLEIKAVSTVGNSFLWIGPYSYRSISPVVNRIPSMLEHSGVYTITVTEPGGCSQTQFVPITVKETPAPTWVNWLNYCQYYSAPPLHPIVADLSTVLWYPSAGFGVTGTTTAPVPNTSVPGIYFYYLNETKAGCSSPIDSIQVVVYPKPEVTMNQSKNALCPGDTMTMNAFRTDSFSTIRWKPWFYVDDTTKESVIAKPIANITYSVIATSRYGCTDTAVAQPVTVYPSGVITISTNYDSVRVFPGEAYQIDLSSNCVVYQWFPTTGVNNVNVANPVITPMSSGTYYVTGITEYGCKAMDSINFAYKNENEYTMPNAFTPGSGVNNEFKLMMRGIAGLRHFRIFNRWGVLLFETKDINIGWDGSYKGEPQPFGVYIYDVEAVSSINGKVFRKHGNVTLIR